MNAEHILADQMWMGSALQRGLSAGDLEAAVNTLVAAVGADHLATFSSWNWLPLLLTEAELIRWSHAADIGGRQTVIANMRSAVRLGEGEAYVAHRFLLELAHVVKAGGWSPMCEAQHAGRSRDILVPGLFHMEAKAVTRSKKLANNLDAMREIAQLAFGRINSGCYRIDITGNPRSGDLLGAVKRAVEENCSGGGLREYADDILRISATGREGLQPTQFDISVFPAIGLFGIESMGDSGGSVPLYLLQDMGYGRRILVVGPAFDPLRKFTDDLDAKIHEGGQVVDGLPNIFAYRPSIFMPGAHDLHRRVQAAMCGDQFNALSAVLFQLPAKMGDEQLPGMSLRYVIIPNPTAAIPLSESIRAGLSCVDEILWPASGDAVAI